MRNLVATTIIVVVVWCATVSLTFLWLGGLLDAPLPMWTRATAWFAYLGYFGRDLIESVYLLISPCLATAVSGVLGMWMLGFWAAASAKRPVYGETKPATDVEMHRRGLRRGN